MPQIPQNHTSYTPFTLGTLTPLRFLFIIPYILLLFAGLAVPSDGNHGILSIKSLAFISSVISLIVYITISNRVSKAQLKLIIFFLFSLGFLLLWAILNNSKDSLNIHSLFDQFKIFWLTLSVIGISLFVVEEGLISYPTLLKTILYINFTYSAFKVFLTLLFLLQVIQLDVFLKFLGIRYMSMGIYANLSRLQTSMDILTPFLMLFLFTSDELKVHLKPQFKNAYVIISLIAILLSFSRFLFFVAGCSIFFYWMTLSGRKIVKRFSLSFLVVCALCTWIGWDKVYKVVEVRFFSEAVEESDSVRVQQIRALMNEFDKAPLLGGGLGSFAPDYIRDETNPHAYEVQWVSFLMQFGLIGILLMMIPILLITIQYLTRPFTRLKTAYLLLFFLWILSGFTNPFLISLASGILYSLFILTAKQLQIGDEQSESIQYSNQTNDHTRG
jgi:hypothetical protein